MHSISMHNHHQLPCLHCHPHSYIRTVQHLIERCLLLRMSRDQCIKALAEHARIWPLVTLTGRQYYKAPRFARRKQYWK
ncbi:uncharacterized protein LOC117916562 isoform X3 [Vitis riparia]|uniref:uncharacterized protein LOC117916562 isoform X3 n=1 Tax=Vitis riparia TaxID=96939 RepID=UPI00155B0552|nr:uncharacterized protein LOC117916562 isoform X3 [Vitis riparia]